MKLLRMLLGCIVFSCAGFGALAQDLVACGGEKGYPTWVQDGLYQGKLGPLEIAMQIKRKAPEKTAYFYQSQGTNLQLQPFHDGERLILQELSYSERDGQETVTGCFEFSAPPSLSVGASWAGHWSTPDHKRQQKVQLRRLDLSAAPLRAQTPGWQRLRREDPLNFLKLNRPWLEQRNAVKEPRTGLSYPRLVGAESAVNRWLEDQQLKLVLEALECRSMVARADQYTYQVQAEVTWQSPKLIGLREIINYDCGGAHPDSMTRTTLLDRHTLREVKPTAIWPSLNPVQLKELYVQAARPKLEADCLSLIQEMLPEMGAVLTKNGLSIVTSALPHAAAPCVGPEDIPYSTLRAKANQQSAYYREIYRDKR